LNIGIFIFTYFQYSVLYNTKKKKIKMISEAEVHHRRF